jgi:dTMP kinase
MVIEKKGLLIAVEGIDGSGKSTLIKNLSKLLEKDGYAVLQTREPGGSWIGKHIRPLLQNQPKPITPIAEYLLFAADRAQHMEDVIEPALGEGKIVISDRMGDSSIAYQGYGRNLGPEIIIQINTWAMQSIQPDITIYIDIDLDTTFSRIEESRGAVTAFEKLELQKKVLMAYKEMYQNRADIIWLDGTMSKDALVNKAYEELLNRIKV